MKKKKKKKKKGKRAEEKGEREEQRNTIYDMGNESSTNREISDIKFTKISITRAQQTDIRYTYIHTYVHTHDGKTHGKTRRRFLESNAREFIIFPMIRVIYPKPILCEWRDSFAK